ncbi:von willebrand factor [Stemphylium lycopersici]|uniref:von willebrand factor n=1 Tax=Stemphylium lycopersici TaxID=183478 RepID=A0A364MRE5_STELY|nr:von willebrand factor [Stemphylium lycopersici]RAQ98676.1 von willebrand factor [Stemphylium lycopersici]RAR00622.1 von willebrand factor [Stemphylium lycopersici]
MIRKVTDALSKHKPFKSSGQIFGSRCAPALTAHSPSPTGRNIDISSDVSTIKSGSTNEAPPAYTPKSGLDAAAISPPLATTTSDDDPYAFLKTFDTVFLIDDSGSMIGRSWRETQEALQTITPICTSHDEDGIDIYFLNHPGSSLHKSVKQASTIIEIFQTVRPSGATPTGKRLNKILKPYLQRYEKDDKTKPMNIIVITDGEPSDDVESAIIQAAKKLDKLNAPPWQVGIQFFQVGKEPGAREHLKKLDDGLAELAKDDDLRDIVDTVPFTGAGDEKLSATGIMKVVLGSVNRRLDRTSKELHR